MAGFIQKAKERFFRLSHIDPVEGVKEILQPEEVKQLVGEIKAEFERRREERRAFELQWRLNQNFIAGHQYCDILETTGEVADYPASYEWEMRTVYNQIAPIVETRLSKLSRVQPGLIVRPSTADTRDVVNASTSTKELKNAYAAHDMGLKIAEANSWAETCGGVFYKSTWDTTGGFLLGVHDGKPVYEGDIACTVVPYYEIFPSTSYVHDLDDCDNIIHAKVYTADEIKLHWGLTIEGRTLNVFSMDVAGMVPGGVGYNPSMMRVRDNEIDNAELVLEYFERPNSDFPEGRHVIIIGDVCVHVGVLPYRCGKFYRRGYPFTHQRCLDNPGVLWGSTVVERCIPIQRDYNAVRNRINEYMARMTIGNMVVERGSLVDDSILDTGLPPGTVVEFKEGMQPPAWMTPQEIPATMLQQVDALYNEFVQISGVSEMSRTSQSPAAISSGTALEILKEQDDTRLTLTSENIRNAIKCLGQVWLRIYRQFATVPRLARIVGDNIGDVRTIIWKGSDLTSDDVIVDTDNEMTNTPAQRKQLALELLQIGLFADPDTGRMTRETRAKLMEVFQLGNWDSAIDIDELHSIKAQREALDLEAGTIPKIMDLDNHTLHTAEHIKYALSADFRKIAEREPELAKAWLAHIEDHKEINVRMAMALAGQGDSKSAHVASLVTDGNAPSEAMQIASSQDGATGGNPNLVGG